MNLYEIVQDRLWISGELTDGSWREKGINVVVNMAEELNDEAEGSLFPGWGGLYIHAPIPDAAVDDPELIQTLAKLVLLLVSQGRKVLVHCAAGYNRSALVAVRAIIEAGHRPVDAVATVRIIRGGAKIGDNIVLHALMNPAFELWLLKEGPKASVMDATVINPRPDGEDQT